MDKEFILSEIRRTADENGGAPLGKRRFERETGITERHWLGKMWARWNDAVVEAGLEGNEPTVKHSEDYLLSQIAALIRHLGHYPTSSETRLYAHQGADFPSDKTIRRFGSKMQILAKLRDRFGSNPDYADLIAICETVTVRAQNVADYLKEPSSSFGTVYLMKSGRHFKIGRTNSAGRREYELAIQLPERAEIVHTIRTDDPVGIELYWHQRFKEKRMNGEWFKLDSDDVSAFKLRRFM